MNQLNNVFELIVSWVAVPFGLVVLIAVVLTLLSTLLDSVGGQR